MIIFKWSHDLETGITLIDQQHRKIIDTANKFFIRHKCGKDAEGILSCLEFLLQYIQYHFQAEEAFQSKSNYPKYAEHRAIHEALATQVKFYSVRIAASLYDEKVIAEFYQFLIEWVKNHIFIEDMDFAEYYKKQLQSG